MYYDNGCNCGETTNMSCPVHGLDRVEYRPVALIGDWEDRFIVELMRLNKIKAKKEVARKSFLHSEEVRVKMRNNP